MGQNFCSCSVQYVKGYDALPDRIADVEYSTIRKESIGSFQSHKIVTTISMSPIYQENRRKRKSKNNKTNKKRKNNENNEKLRLDDVPPIDMDNFEEINNVCINKTFVLYEEGICIKSDGESNVLNTITTGCMLDMDISGTSNILENKFQLNHIISRAPQTYHIMKWKMVYSLLNHGCSMQTFYGNTQHFDQSILIIKDQSNNIFGAFVDSKWKAEYDHYNGSKNCFVYKFDFEQNEYSIFEYHSSGTKPFFLQSDYNGITIGAGECPAIYIENNLLMGRTTKSDTFHSEPLSPNTIFQIQDIEIWAPFFE